MAYRAATNMKFARFLSVCVLILVSGGWFNFREDELACEEAAAHLEDCCPNFSATTIVCQHSGSCDSAVEPAITLEETTCIRERSCERLVAARVCERAAETLPIAESSEGATPTPRSPVCP